jgi:hypothetical protein
MSSYWLAHFHLMKKIRQKAPLIWFGLWDVGMLYSQTVIQRTIEHMQAVIQTSRRLDSFLHEVGQNFELLSNIQDQK